MFGRLGQKKEGLWTRLKKLAFTDVNAIMRGMNAADLEAMERTLIEADFGVASTVELTNVLEEGVRQGRLRTENDLKAAIGSRIAELVASPDVPTGLVRNATPPTVVLIVGVNGVGKTTSVAKLARLLQREGRSVMVAAADTYRAGAIQQLQVWADRLKIACVAGAPGGDPAAVAFDAVEAAAARGVDTVLIDTAGRLHTQDSLMDELRKVVRVVSRKLPGAPHETLLVLDGTVGQNAIQQGRLFMQAVQPTGLIVTKLDGTARGGAVLAIRRELGLPIRFIGVGETVDDLEAFDARRYADRLLEDDEG